MDKVLGQKPTVSGIVPVLIKSITDANELDWTLPAQHKAKQIHEQMIICS